MKSKDSKIEELIEQEAGRIYRGQPVVEAIDVAHHVSSKGVYKLKVTAKTRRKIISLSKKSRCAQTSVRKAFNTLKNLLKKERSKRYIRPKRHTLEFENAV